MFFTDENHCYRGILEMVNTNSSAVLRKQGIFWFLRSRKSLTKAASMLTKVPVHRSEAETLDKGGNPR